MRLRSLVLGTACLAALSCTDGTGPSPGAPAELALVVAEAAGLSAVEGRALDDAFDRIDRFRVTVVDSLSGTAYADTVVQVEAGAPSHTLAVRLPPEALGALLSIRLVGLQGDVPLFTATQGAVVTADDDEVVAEVTVRYTGPGIRGSVAGDDGNGLGGVTVRALQAGAEIASETTAPDGTFLFLDLPPGSYTVRIEAPAGLSPCPGEREVSLAGTTSAVVAGFHLRRGGCTVRVLVLSGGDVDDTGVARGELSGAADVAVDAFFVVARTPGLAELRRYDVVLVYQNGLFGESAALGTELAQYVALGGNVVFGSFYWQGRSDSGTGAVGWGPLEAIDPFASAGGAVYSPGSLGTVEPHPLTQGVASLSSSGFRGGVAARGGTRVVARWSDGTPLVGYRTESAGQRLVGVSLHPAHRGRGALGGDVATLWSNAVRWAGAAGGPARTGPAPGGP